MKASELRIGNLVLLKCNNQRDEIAKLLSIDEIDGCYYNNASNKKYINNKYTQKNNGWCSFNIINPIPLTKEWLVKFGFGETDKCYYIDKLYLKKIDFQPIGEEETDIIFYKLEYVHQLQTLYFALTNEELTLIK